MSTRLKARAIRLAPGGGNLLLDGAYSAMAEAQSCGSKEYAHNTYTVCEVDLARHTVRLYCRRSDGTPYAHQLMIIAHCPPADFEKMLSPRRAKFGWQELGAGFP
jgi:hypothetical protein